MQGPSVPAEKSQLELHSMVIMGGARPWDGGMLLHSGVSGLWDFGGDCWNYTFIINLYHNVDEWKWIEV